LDLNRKECEKARLKIETRSISKANLILKIAFIAFELKLLLNRK